MDSGAGDIGGKATDWSPPTPNRKPLIAVRAPRVPYFERPKPPHDWRWIVGGIGRSLIATGLLMFAFVGYQLWGTGIQTAQAQDRLENKFHDQLAATTTSVTPDTEVGPDTSTTIPTAPSRPAVPNGDPVAQLKIPKIGLSVYIVEGVRYNDLKNGPGHFKETPMPGQLGNSAIAGHRTTWGHPFLELDQLDPGDRITVVTVDGTYVYSVTSTEIVSPSDYAKVIPTTDPDRATLTLATCHPAYTARQRLIVHADLVVAESDQVMRPPTDLPAADPDGLPGDSIPTSTTEGSTVDTTVPSTVAVDEADPPQQSDDAFAHGWFSDGAAIPHALGWGFVLLSVVLGAFYVGKAARRLYVCFLVGAIPFVVVLYFFFQNVNRLLPPGL